MLGNITSLDDLKFVDLFYGLRNFIDHKRPITDAYIGTSLYVGRKTTGWARHKDILYEYRGTENENPLMMTGADNARIMEDTIDNFKTKIYEGKEF